MGVRGRPTVPRVTVGCAACGAPVSMRESDYARRTTGRIFCNDTCRKRAGSKPRRGKTQPCETCGVEVYSRPGAVGRFCSTQCHNTHQKLNRVDLVCPVCGEAFSLGRAAASYRGDSPTCSRRCDTERRMKNGIGHYHNGRQVLRWSSGYLYVWEPTHPFRVRNGWVPEHRHVVERYLGRYLERTENVHHINGIKYDNRLENLEVLGHSEHSRLTQAERKQQQAADAAELAEYRRRFGPLD